MPDSTGRLSRKEQETVVKKFREWEVNVLDGDLECELCHGKFWNLSPHLVGMHSDSTGHALPILRTPMVLFSCGDCGNSKFFIASLMGVSPIGSRIIPSVSGGEKDGD
jgi:hypothetical protein